MPNPKNTIPEKIRPGEPDTTGSLGLRENLSDRLNRSEGVIKPPGGLDPEMDVPAPVPDPGTTLVLPRPVVRGAMSAFDRNSANAAAGRSRARMLACRRRAALLILLSLVGSVGSVGAALGRDERWAERVTADDDPILIPRFAMPHSLDGTPARASPDPPTTGSVAKPVQRARPRCTLIGWFPDRPPDQEFREVC